MIRVALNDQDGPVLAEVLASYLSDLRYEISNTDLLDFREKLRAKQHVLEKVLAALETGGE